MDRRELQNRSEHRVRSQGRDSPAAERSRRPSSQELERARRERVQRKAEARRRLEEAEGRKRAEFNRDGRRSPNRTSSVQRQVSRPAAETRPSRENGEPRERRPKPTSNTRRKRPPRKPIPLRAKIIIGAVLIVVTVAILSLTVLFSVETVTIAGETRYTPEEIVMASGITVGEDNLFLCGRDSGAAIQKQLPYIGAVKIQKKLPNTVVINVTETNPMFCMLYDKQWYTLDAGHKLLAISGKQPKNLMVVKGLLIDRSALGETTIFFEAAKLRALEELCQVITEGGIQKVVNINLENSLDIRMNYDNRFIVKLGIPNELDTKIRLVMAVIRERLSDTDKGTLDISGGKNVHYNPNEYAELDKDS